MTKRIPSAQPALSPVKKSRSVAGKTETGPWKGRILLCLESPDPRILDKETHKVYLRILATGVKLQGPVPLPVHRPEGPVGRENAGVLHRRLFRITIPTQEFIPLLEKLPLSSSVTASFRVEEEDPLLPGRTDDQEPAGRKDRIS